MQLRHAGRATLLLIAAIGLGVVQGDLEAQKSAVEDSLDNDLQSSEAADIHLDAVERARRQTCTATSTCTTCLENQGCVWASLGANGTFRPN